MRLWLVRHGETAWNKDEIFRGQIDVELDEYGQEQARLTGAALSSLDMAAVYASPLGRAQETAQAIAGPHGLAVISETGLKELNYGSWQGLSHQQVKERYPELYQVWVTAPHQVRFEGGESLDDVRTRVMNALKQMLGRHQGQNVVAVSHRAVNKVLLCDLLGLGNSQFWAIRQDTCAINVIEHDEQHGFVIYRLNDTCHIRPLAELFAAPGQTADF